MAGGIIRARWAHPLLCQRRVAAAVALGLGEADAAVRAALLAAAGPLCRLLLLPPLRRFLLLFRCRCCLGILLQLLRCPLLRLL